MAAIVTNKFRIHNAEQFNESFSEASANVYYMMLGRPQAFATSTRPDGRTENEGTDSAPLTPVDSIDTEFYTFDDAIAAKKITSSDISYVIPRRNWTAGVVYDYYRHDYGRRITGTTTTQTANSGAATLYDSTFYVMNSTYDVYKVLDNNGNSATTSGNEPSGTGTTVITTGDGYKYKYMYSLSAAQQTNFLSTDFMAVATNGTVAAAASDGIDIIKVKTGGTGYTTSGASGTGTITSVPIRGDGSSGTATVTIASGIITSVAVSAAGSGYTYGYITNADIQSQGGGTGTGAELDVIIPPKDGHGKDAVKELGGFFVMLNVNFEGAEAGSGSDVTVTNDFRRVALIRDPDSGGSAASATTLRGTKAIRMAASPTPGTFQVDEEINQATTGAVGKVVEWDATNRILYYIQTRFNDEGADSNGNLTAFSTAAVITGQSSSATATPDTGFTDTVNGASFTSGYSASELDADTGDIIYIENRAPITRASDQTENIKLIVEF
jgi:hypothetical protein